MGDVRDLSGDSRATPKGRPGPDIEKLRRQQKRMKFDSKTVALALSRIYKTRQHAIKEEL